MHNVYQTVQFCTVKVCYTEYKAPGHVYQSMKSYGFYERFLSILEPYNVYGKVPLIA